jgi:large subunit ribosomal protein L28
MARVCEICKKRTTSGGSIARRGLPKSKGGVGLRTTGHTLRKFLPNIQRVRAVVGGEVKRISVCTRCIKSGKVTKPLRAKTSSG